MTVKLRCAATGDLLLLSASAKALLALLGKDAGEAGVLEVKDMGRALAALRAIEEPVAPVSQPSNPDEPLPPPLPFVEEPVSLRKRAWPLIQMIERAQAADKPIVWGV